MTKSIKKGYQLHITTWENDGDHYATEVIDGLNKDEVTYLVTLAKLFRNWGNDEPDADEVWDTVSAIPVPEGVREEFRYEDFDDFHDGFICNYIGYSYESSVYRVYDGFKVFYYEVEVPNVTEEFK